MSRSTSENIPLTAYTLTNADEIAHPSQDEDTTQEHRGEEEEEEHLIDKDESDGEDDAWLDSGEDENGNQINPTLWDLPLLRYTLLAVTVGLLFVLFKILVAKYGHGSEHHNRPAEHMYFNGTDFFGPTVILISLDGFRSEYLHRNITPNLDELASKGIRAEYMHPSFPPSTFPNHWTLVTGLYPEAHGIVGNTFYDPALDKEFIYNNNEITKQSEWWGGEPLWVTSALQGLRTAVDMWPGSTASVNHVRPNFVVGFNSTVTPLEKIDTVLGWLDLAQNERPQFMAVYVPQVDIVGHEKGPDSEEINDAIIDVDNAIGHLIEELTERNLGRHVHVIVVSDHGMSSTGPSKLIYYDDILSPESLASLREREAMPLLDIRPNANASFDRMVNKIYRELHNYTENSPDPHFKVFLRKDVPSRYHYSNTDRITPIVAIPDVGYTFVLHDEVAPNAQKTFLTLGHHGYDNLAPDMRAIFIAKGPKLNLRFNHGAVVIPFFNVEVYGLITELLNIVAAPNNGTLQGGFFATSLTH